MSRRTNKSSSTTKMDLPANVQRLSTLASGPNFVPAPRPVVISRTTLRPISLSRRQARQRCTRFHCCNAVSRWWFPRGQRAPRLAEPGSQKSPLRTRARPRCRPPQCLAQLPPALPITLTRRQRCLLLRTAWLPHQPHRTRHSASSSAWRSGRSRVPEAPPCRPILPRLIDLCAARVAIAADTDPRLCADNYNRRPVDQQTIDSR